MCGRFEILTLDELTQVISLVDYGTPLNLVPDWPAVPGGRTQVRPGDVTKVLVPAQVGLRTQNLTWGFEREHSRGLVFNTRIERAFGDAGMWASALSSGRCLVPATAFFEPHGTETVLTAKGQSVKAQYRFEGDGPLLMAGVQQAGRFSVVTTEPPMLVQPIHDRCPLLLTPDAARLWLAGGAQALGASGIAALVEQAVTGMRTQRERRADEQLSLFD